MYFVKNGFVLENPSIKKDLYFWIKNNYNTINTIVSSSII